MSSPTSTLMPTSTQALQLKVLTPQSSLFEGAIASVYVATTEGEVGLLKGHAPFMAQLAMGVLRLQTLDGQSKRVALMGGLLKVEANQVLVLAEVAELADSIDILRASEAKKRAEERLKLRESSVDHHRAKLSLHRALSRLKAAQG
jgi:F-type H+-transporting ATPase subunit epsilon